MLVLGGTYGVLVAVYPRRLLLLLSTSLHMSKRFL